MAKVFPFQPYRYSAEAGPLDQLLTQPYDKIAPEMQRRYLAASPNNLVRIELGERRDTDNDSDNVYTRAERQLGDWIASGVLRREEKPSFFPYSQQFEDPDSGERLTRKGFIGLAALEEYSAGVVFRHEQTLTGPKQDRMELLRRTRAHTGQIFVLYQDRHFEVERMLDQAAQAKPIEEARDEYGVLHTAWRISDDKTIARMQKAMADKKLLIADGHHRYETALAYHREQPGLAEAGRVMMTFVNMYSPGLRVLATHRVLDDVDPDPVTARAHPLASLDELRARWKDAHAGIARVGLATARGVWMLDLPRPPGRLDVEIAHDEIIGTALGIGDEAIRRERHIRYVRGLDAAIGEVRSGGAELAILLEPTPVEEVARVAFSGKVLPQKSTDFYPKLLSGITIYRLEK